MVADEAEEKRWEDETATPTPTQAPASRTQASEQGNQWQSRVFPSAAASREAHLWKGTSARILPEQLPSAPLPAASPAAAATLRRRITHAKKQAHAHDTASPGDGGAALPHPAIHTFVLAPVKGAEMAASGTGSAGRLGMAGSDDHDTIEPQVQQAAGSSPPAAAAMPSLCIYQMEEVGAEEAGGAGEEQERDCMYGCGTVCQTRSTHPRRCSYSYLGAMCVPAPRLSGRGSLHLPALACACLRLPPCLRDAAGFYL